jgi:hypothetical protein
MKRTSFTEAKNNLSGLIDSVKGGSPVLIVTVDGLSPGSKPSRGHGRTTVGLHSSCGMAS